MVLSTVGSRTTGYQYRKKMNFNYHLILYSKVSLIWNIDLKVKAKTKNLPEENRGKRFCDIKVGKDFVCGNYTELNIKDKHW